MTDGADKSKQASQNEECTKEKKGSEGMNVQGRGRDERPLEEIIEEGIGIDEGVSLTPEEEADYDRRHGNSWPR